MKNLIIMNNIKCNTACPILLQQFNSCPIKEKIDLFEICMILLSLSPYICIMINLFTLVKYRTTRSLSLFGMFIVQVIFILLRIFLLSYLRIFSEILDLIITAQNNSVILLIIQHSSLP